MIPKLLHIFHSTAFEKWGPWTPDERGIGNSETAQIELGKRFAKRGWAVTSYAPLPEGRHGIYDGVLWLPLEDADFGMPGHWMIWRAPEVLDQFPVDHPLQRLYLVSQDESYKGRWNDGRVAKLDSLFALCEAHRESLRSDHPGLYEKARVSSNGIRMDLIREIDQEDIERNPYRIMYASSPDRGLENLLKMWPRIREWVSKAELHCFYGLNNMRVLAGMPGMEHFGRTADRIEKLCDQPGVTWHGRVDQRQILREWRKSALLVSPTYFRETSFVSMQEAQAMGAIPVVSPQWAAIENLCGGAFVQGDPADDFTRCRFIHQIYQLLANPGMQEQIRKVMVPEARLRFNWERQVDKYEAELLGLGDHPGMVHSQFNFQLKHCVGFESILNVGCADDPANLKALGAINIDARSEDPIFHRPTAADIVIDVRNLDDRFFGKFNRVVCGDMLEHFHPQAVPYVLFRLRQCLSDDGLLVLTIPDDRRALNVQHAGSEGEELYMDGVSALHTHPISLEMIQQWLKDAWLEMVGYEEMDCGHYMNHGVLARAVQTPSEGISAIDQILREAK